ncbi:hypothetical protein DJ82_10455 [Halorubrum sp. Ib24]|uniref:hypothetical protein n=1 Tax=unclassified Halorubrum TaxID=2642239 RepID=UPI000B984601|nr:MULTISPECIES: hypothetical protein [unclassified Halorubrum]OYR38859.1 hypothetical protein DJ82_10455 [Halorubrum sp. Ib24]OYR43875.1 hypothetical protein DJ74_18145 [Halorubrum sp. Ea8]OYR46915.1 hypothetical protein DJ81_01935 [Halorubrum sp. Hd13]OYR48701.1 hypothetical protein DJ75_02325 [Halorubrum sp. Eb13]
MSEPEFDESVVKADKRSKAVALIVAIAAFLVVRELVVDVQFASIVAATAGVGVRLYVPYHASVRVPESDRTSLSDHPTVGAYHHGAAGIGLVVLSVIAVAAFAFTQGFVTSVGVGIIAGVVAYVVLSSTLPAG